MVDVLLLVSVVVVVEEEEEEVDIVIIPFKEDEASFKSFSSLELSFSEYRSLILMTEEGFTGPTLPLPLPLQLLFIDIDIDP